jgi:hypothetical protein
VLPVVPGTSGFLRTPKTRNLHFDFHDYRTKGCVSFLMSGYEKTWRYATTSTTCHTGSFLRENTRKQIGFFLRIKRQILFEIEPVEIYYFVRTHCSICLEPKLSKIEQNTIGFFSLYLDENNMGKNLHKTRLKTLK